MIHDYPIVIKLCTNVGLVKMQINFVDKLCGANRQDFLKEKTENRPRGRNFDSIVIKLGTLVDVIKIKIRLVK